jgi:hypothetical protein
MSPFEALLYFTEHLLPWLVCGLLCGAMYRTQRLLKRFELGLRRLQRRLSEEEEEATARYDAFENRLSVDRAFIRRLDQELSVLLPQRDGPTRRADALPGSGAPENAQTPTQWERLAHDE